MRKSFLFIFAFAFVTQLKAQEQTLKKTTLYFETCGNGLGLSINYERLLSPSPGIGLHMGIGLGGNKPSIISGAKYLIGLGNSKSFLEAGFGITFTDREHMGAKRNTQNYRNPYTLAYIPSVGYRHHTRYGLMWRVNYTPVFSKYNTVALYPGISVGWRF